MYQLTYWGRVTHICVNKLTIIGSDNGLSPDHRQAIIWTNAGILLIGLLGTNFSEILIEILTFSLIQENAFESVVCETVAILSRPQCVNQLSHHLNRVWPLPSGQSAYIPFHSTETALLKVQSDILLNMGEQKVTLLIMLDLSAAFALLTTVSFWRL